MKKIEKIRSLEASINAYAMHDVPEEHYQGLVDLLALIEDDGQPNEKEGY